MNECLTGKGSQKVCDFLQRDKTGRWQCQLLQFGGTPVVLLSPRWRIEWATTSGHDLLRRYWPTWTGQGDRLPDEIREWMTVHHRRRGAADSFPAHLAPLVIDRPPAHLTVRYLRNREVAALLFDEHVFELPSARLASLGLTPRQSDLLRWVAQGKSNAETAKILGISARTVQKHLEHIYDQLNVEHRHAAVAMALETVRNYWKNDKK